MRFTSTLSVLVAAGLALSACGDASDTTAAPANEPSINAQVPSAATTTTEAAATETSESSDDRGPAPTLDDAPPEAPATHEGADSNGSNDNHHTNANPNPGGHSINVGQIGGKCGYTNQGDKIHAGRNTSCEFAAAMFDEAIKHTFTWSQRSPTVNGSYNTRISAVSPATKQSYDLRCAIGSDTRSFYCGIDGDNSVYASFEGANNQRWTDRLSTEGQP